MLEDEPARIQRLVRVMSGFILWPAVTAAIALYLYGRGDPHNTGFIAYFVLGTVIGVGLYLLAPAIGRRYGQPETPK